MNIVIQRSMNTVPLMANSRRMMMNLTEGEADITTSSELLHTHNFVSEGQNKKHKFSNNMNDGDLFNKLLIK